MIATLPTLPHGLPVTWQENDGLTLHWHPKRQPLNKFAPAPQWLGSSNPYECPFGTKLAQRVATMCASTQKIEGKTPLQWVATPSSLRAVVAGGQFVITTFRA